MDPPAPAPPTAPLSYTTSQASAAEGQPTAFYYPWGGVQSADAAYARTTPDLPQTAVIGVEDLQRIRDALSEIAHARSERSRSRSGRSRSRSPEASRKRHRRSTTASPVHTHTHARTPRRPPRPFVVLVNMKKGTCCGHVYDALQDMIGLRPYKVYIDPDEWYVKLVFDYKNGWDQVARVTRYRKDLYRRHGWIVCN